MLFKKNFKWFFIEAGAGAGEKNIRGRSWPKSDRLHNTAHWEANILVVCGSVNFAFKYWVLGLKLTGYVFGSGYFDVF